MKLKYSKVDDFELIISNEKQCVVLNEQLSLAQIVQNYAADVVGVEILLHYRLSRVLF